MPKTTPPDEPSRSALDDAVTVPRFQHAEQGSAIELSSSSILEEVKHRGEAEALIGKTISERYVVHELIGQGGMGAVYRGEQVHLRKRVAIKVLRPGIRSLPDLVARFEREAVAGAHVQHPNVVPAVDFGKLEDGSYFLALEYVEGTPLKDVIEKEAPLSVERALRIARQIASALAAVHDKGIVHRDIKPQNVLLGARDSVKLIDFGLAKVPLEMLSSESRAAARPNVALTGVGTIMGTLAYMAPEASGGMEAVDARADLYALGIVLYEMLTGLHPFEGHDGVAIFKRQKTEDPPAMRDRAPNVKIPPEVEAIVMRLIQRDPARRYATTPEVVTAIDGALWSLERALATTAPASNEKPAAPAAIALPRAARPAPALPRQVLLMAAGAAVLLVGIVIVLLVRRGGADEKPAVASSSAQVTAAPAPSASPVAAPTEIEGLDAAGWQINLHKATVKREWVRGARALLALAKLDPDRVTGNALREDVLAVVAGIGFETKLEESDQVFDLLENGLGTGGLDILFDVVRTRGGTKAGNRANEILARPGVMERATPALRIAYELRKATCDEKRALFDRAAEEGDARALGELQIARNARCSSKKDPCCFREDEAIAAAMKKLAARLGG
jgi:serine/threonine-protein kinase